MLEEIISINIMVLINYYCDMHNINASTDRDELIDILDRMVIIGLITHNEYSDARARFKSNDRR